MRIVCALALLALSSLLFATQPVYAVKGEVPASAVTGIVSGASPFDSQLSQAGHVPKDFGGDDIRGGAPSADRIRAVISAYNRGLLSESGIVECIQRSSNAFGIKATVLLAQAQHETAMGRTGTGRPTRFKNLFGLNKGIPDGPGVRSRTEGRYKVYPTYCDSVIDYAAYMKRKYVNRGITRLSQIIPIYAPAGDCIGIVCNSPPAYIARVTSLVRKWDAA